MSFFDKVTTTKDSTQLQVGDVVRVHGARFRLVEAVVGEHNAMGRALASVMYDHAKKRGPREEREYLEMEGTLRSFRTEYLGPVSEEFPVGVPSSWRHDWTVQGNKFARWTVEVVTPWTRADLEALCRGMGMEERRDADGPGFYDSAGEGARRGQLAIWPSGYRDEYPAADLASAYEGGAYAVLARFAPDLLGLAA